MLTTTEFQPSQTAQSDLSSFLKEGDTLHNYHFLHEHDKVTVEIEHDELDVSFILSEN